MGARLGVLGAGLLGLALVSGCASQRAPGAEHAAVEFLRAAGNGDGSTACALLSPSARSGLEQSEQMPCDRAVLDASVPPASGTRAVHVSGEAAQVVLRTDTVFLSEFSDGWRVVAAGCRDRGGRPYDCRLQGG